MWSLVPRFGIADVVSLHLNKDTYSVWQTNSDGMSG